MEYIGIGIIIAVVIAVGINYICFFDYPFKSFQMSE